MAEEHKPRKRLRYEDRKIIEQMINGGSRVEEIADKIGVHKATIYMELRRCGGKYTADAAQQTI